ncbi:MAG: P-type conjugative transfer protein TrbG [Caulobacter sp. 32-67-35]|nr:MAG: P-type conjugative transfer protein TrbG [Caulobacter sp. 32-67-35]
MLRPYLLLSAALLAAGSTQAEPRGQDKAPTAAQIARVNRAARVEPSVGPQAGASQVYVYAEGALYQVYATPGRISDIVLEPGEALVGNGAVAAGDTARWIIGDTISGAGAGQRVHVMVKPTRPDLATNLIINTDRRTYHLELRATAAAYLSSVSWRYPAGELVALSGGQPSGGSPASAPAAATSDAVDRLYFGYAIGGKRAAWRPTRVFDDGAQVFIEFPRAVAQDQLPPLFVRGADGKTLELVNYRVRSGRMVVDRLFDIAELRMGTGKRQKVVRIKREARS